MGRPNVPTFVKSFGGKPPHQTENLIYKHLPPMNLCGPFLLIFMGPKSTQTTRALLKIRAHWLRRLPAMATATAHWSSNGPRPKANTLALVPRKRICLIWCIPILHIFPAKLGGMQCLHIISHSCMSWMLLRLKVLSVRLKRFVTPCDKSREFARNWTGITEDPSQDSIDRSAQMTLEFYSLVVRSLIP